MNLMINLCRLVVVV